MKQKYIDERGEGTRKGKQKREHVQEKSEKDGNEGEKKR